MGYRCNLVIFGQSLGIILESIQQSSHSNNIYFIFIHSANGEVKYSIIYCGLSIKKFLCTFWKTVLNQETFELTSSKMWVLPLSSCGEWVPTNTQIRDTKNAGFGELNSTCLFFLSGLTDAKISSVV